MIKLISPAVAVESTEAFSRQMMDIKSQANMIRDRIAELEAEEGAILHRLERLDCLYKERGRLATRLRAVLMERRAYKDWLHSMKTSISFLDSDKGDRLWKGTAEYLGLARKARSDDERKTIIKAEVVR